MTVSEATRGWRPDIQGLRGVAVILVVAFHAGLPLPGGFTGVDVFFVISGFVIGQLILRQLASDDGFGFRRFYARRIVRLLPALTLMLVVVVLLSALLPSPMGQPQETLKTAIGTVFLAANIVLERSFGGYFQPRLESNPLLNTWSLSVEEQFYLVLPAVLVVAWVVARRFQWNPRRVGAVAISVVALGSLLMLVGAPLLPAAVAPSVEAFTFFSATTRAWEFCVGVLLVLLLNEKHLSQRWANALVGLGIILILAGAFVISPESRFPGPLTLLPVAGAALAIASANQSRVGGVVFGNRPLVWVGDLSYSWYLWHWPIIVFAAAVFGDEMWVSALAGLFSLLPAALSRRFVEIPFMRRMRLSIRQSFALFIALNGLVLLVIAGTLAFISSGFLRPWSMNAHSAIQNGCDGPNPDLAKCTWNAGPESVGSVLVVGDSNAWSSADGVIAAAEEQRMTTIVASTNGCPFISRERIEPQGPCSDAQESSWKVVEQVSPDILVVANNRSESVDESHVDSLLSDLNRLVDDVLFIEKDVGGDSYSGRQSILVSLGSSTRRVEKVESRAAIPETSSATVLPLSRALCEEKGCFVAKDGVEFFTDPGHLSREGALLLTPELSDYLARTTSR